MLPRTKKIHFIGIGGIGMSAVAKLLIENGKEVSGSDITSTDITHDLELKGVRIHSGHAPTNVPDDVELVIYSSAVPDDNIERVKGKELGVPEQSYAEFLGELSKHYSTIVVTGTNGKSTTTSMLALMLEDAGYDPTVIVGSLVPGFKQGNLRVGKGRFLVLEGCEHNAQMMHLEPEMIVLTNIEADHLDYYRDLDHIRETFQKFVDKLQGKGMTIWNADDPESQKLSIGRPVSFGMESQANYRGHDRKTRMGSQKISISRILPLPKGELEGVAEQLGDIILKIPGQFNAMNALAALAAAMELGVPFEACKKVLEAFTGTWRRFERVGVWHGADIISDYGHHPTSVAATVWAARELFPGRRIVLCFEPHQHSRTQELFDDFVEAIPMADHIIVSEIYDVAGRLEAKDDMSSKLLVEAIKKKDPGKDIQFAEDLERAESMVREMIKANDVVLVMGAGNVDVIARNLAE